MKIKLIYLCCFLLSSSCYQSKTLVVGDEDSQKSYSELNSELKKKKVFLHLANGDSVAAWRLTVNSDSISWESRNSGKTYCISKDQVKKISRKRRNTGKGAGQGFLIGASLGALTGAALGADDCSEDGATGALCLERADVAFIGSLFIGVPFSLIGLINGAANVTTDSYLLQEPGK